MGVGVSKARFQDFGDDGKHVLRTPLGRRIRLQQRKEFGDCDPLLIDNVLCSCAIDPSLAPGFVWDVVEHTVGRSQRLAACLGIKRLEREVALTARPSSSSSSSSVRQLSPALVEAFCLACGYEGPHPNSATGWVPLGWDELWSVLGRLVDAKLIVPFSGSRIVDLGSGSGSAAVLFSSLGLRTVGIELNEELHSFSSNLAELCAPHVPSHGSLRFLCGSYFPSSFVRERKSGAAWSLQHESPVSSDHVFFKPVDTPEKSAAVEAELASADVVYCFTWAVQVPSVLEIFSKFTAKKDAILVIVNTSNLVPQELTVIDRFTTTRSPKRTWNRFCIDARGYPCAVYCKEGSIPSKTLSARL